MKQFRVTDILLEATMWTSTLIALMVHINNFIYFHVCNHAIMGIAFTPDVTSDFLGNLHDSNPYPALSNFDYWLFFLLMVFSLYSTIKRIMESRGYEVKLKPKNKSHDTTEDRK